MKNSARLNCRSSVGSLFPAWFPVRCWACFREKAFAYQDFPPVGNERNEECKEKENGYRAKPVMGIIVLWASFPVPVSAGHVGHGVRV